MGEQTAIEWTDHTFNPWTGCTKVSEGCANCYAEAMSGRDLPYIGKWGIGGTRRITSESYWKDPIRWNKKAKEAGVRRRVFVASMADVFEGRETMPAESWQQVESARARLFVLIEQTPHLEWLLLTKRPENIVPTILRMQKFWACEGFPGARTGNIRLMTSVENQPNADKRIPELLNAAWSLGGVPTGLSMEPLLGPVDLGRVVHLHNGLPFRNDVLTGSCGYLKYRNGDEGSGAEETNGQVVGWVIVGGESGPNARPMHPDWARSIRDQCVAAGVPFFFKQWGEFVYQTPDFDSYIPHACCIDRFGRKVALSVGKDRRVFTMPSGAHQWREITAQEVGTINDLVEYRRVGKKRAGRELDGREWSEFPKGPIGG